MAVYAVIDNARGIDTTRAIAQGPEAGGLDDRPQVASGVDTTSRMSAMGTKLDARYKAGSWHDDNGTTPP